MSLPYLQPYLGLSNGLNTLHAAGPAGPAVGGWVELARTTLGSSGSTITVSSLSDKRYYMVLCNLIAGSGTPETEFRLNGDSGTNYLWRWSNNGGADGVPAAQNYMVNGTVGFSGNHLGVSYFANYSSKEKLQLGHAVNNGSTGAGTAPNRNEYVGKWVNTSNPISQMQEVNLGGGGSSYASGSELVVLGYDPLDSHTNNYWEELASVDLSGGANRYLSSGTFTTKKYLWIQTFLDYGSGSTLYGQLRVGNGSVDTGTNYSHRYSSNGGSDLTNTSIGYLPHAVNTLNSAGEGIFINTFIINNASNEKLMINHITENYITTAGTAPARREEVAKWVNTSNQINIVEYDGTSGHTFGTNSIMKVWGAD